MRSMSTLQEDLMLMMERLLKFLTEKLAQVSKVWERKLYMYNILLHMLNNIYQNLFKNSLWLYFFFLQNPSKPHFNHYLFESICVGIRNTCKYSPAAVVQFEQVLFEPFTYILQTDVQGTCICMSRDKWKWISLRQNTNQNWNSRLSHWKFNVFFVEFLPYVFQILSLLIDHHPGGQVADTYMALFPHLMAPALWERPGNIPPLVRLLQAYIEKGGKQIEADKIVSTTIKCKQLRRKMPEKVDHR